MSIPTRSIYDEPISYEGFYDTSEFYRYLRDYVVADVDNLAAIEDTTLRKVAKPLTFPLSKEDKEDILDLDWKFESERDGVLCLAAPNIGIPKQILVIRIINKIATTKKTEEFRKTVWINPRFYNVTDEMELGWEECSCVKGHVGQLKRYKKIVYSGFHEDGRPIRGRASGLAARVIQHEIDHLNGKLFIDYIPREKLVTHQQYIEKFHPPEEYSNEEITSLRQTYDYDSLRM